MFGIPSMQSRLALLARVLLLIFCLFVGTACGFNVTPNNSPPEITDLRYIPASTVSFGEEVGIQIEVQSNNHDIHYQWDLEEPTNGGQILGDDQNKPLITYKAPEVAGSYKIRVQLEYDGEEGSKTIKHTALVTVVEKAEPTVVAPSATPSESIPAAETPTVVVDQSAIPSEESIPATETPTVVVDPSATPSVSIPAGETPSATSSKVDQLKQDCHFSAAVQDNFKPFSYLENDQRIGFDIQLMREFARRWCENPDAVELIPVSSACRIPSLKGNQMPAEENKCQNPEVENRADIIAAAFTKTNQRCQYVECSATYFQDGQRLLVRGDEQNILGICDLKDKKIALVQGTTAIDNVRQKARECGFEPQITEFSNRDEAIASLTTEVLTNRHDAYSTDGIALENIAEGKPLKVVGNHFSHEPYGLGLPNNDEPFARLVRLTLEEIVKDGTFANLYYQFFQDKMQAYRIEMLPDPINDSQLQELVTSQQPAIIPQRAKEVECSNPYVVQAGEWLSSIAGKCYGDSSPQSWGRIYEANKELMANNPDRLLIGWQLTIPR